LRLRRRRRRRRLVPISIPRRRRGKWVGCGVQVPARQPPALRSAARLATAQAVGRGDIRARPRVGVVVGDGGCRSSLSSAHRRTGFTRTPGLPRSVSPPLTAALGEGAETGTTGGVRVSGVPLPQRPQSSPSLLHAHALPRDQHSSSARSRTHRMRIPFVVLRGVPQGAGAEEWKTLCLRYGRRRLHPTAPPVGGGGKEGRRRIVHEMDLS
jgi:hypothetical protein